MSIINDVIDILAEAKRMWNDEELPIEKQYDSGDIANYMMEALEELIKTYE